MRSTKTHAHHVETYNSDGLRSMPVSSESKMFKMSTTFRSSATIAMIFEISRLLTWIVSTCPKKDVGVAKMVKRVYKAIMTRAQASLVFFFASFL